MSLMAVLRLFALIAPCPMALTMKMNAMFQRLSHLDGYVGHSYSHALKAETRALCSRLCLSDDGCFSFTFGADSGDCFLHDNHSPLPGASLPGALTFYKKWDHCPADWTLLNGTLCVNVSSVKRTWQDAVQDCRAMGGSLISVETQEKEFLIRNLLESVSIDRAWLGASDLEREGTWTWVDTRKPARIRWAPNEPNGDTTESCLSLFYYFGGSMQMNDAECHNQWYYVCEIPM